MTVNDELSPANQTVYDSARRLIDASPDDKTTSQDIADDLGERIAAVEHALVALGSNHLNIKPRTPGLTDVWLDGSQA